MVVIASVQTLSKMNRLLGFAPNHFSLVIVDEAHRILAETYLRIVNYFHFGKESLAPDWKMPEGPAPHKARILGVTATDDRGDRRSLGLYFQHCAFEYGLIDGCRDGYLVRPIVKNIPLKIDIKGVHTRGKDLDATEVAERLMPLLREIAKVLNQETKDRKTIVFLPSVDSARRLSACCSELGMNASFVSGACADRTAKVTRFRAGGPGTVICNAMVLTEGFDDPDVSCVCILRPTKIRSLYVQCAGRASRPLTGLIDGIEDKEDRIEAIRASRKSNMLILDFLWLSDDLDLVRPVDLVTTRSDLREKMQDSVENKPVVDLLDTEVVASRDLLKSLEMAAKRNANKQARVLDPLSWAVDLGDERLATYRPETQFDSRPPTAPQLEMLRRHHFDTSRITSLGQASMVLGKLMARFKMKLCTPQQLSFLHKLGFPAEQAATLTIKDATLKIDELLETKKARRASSARPSPPAA